MHPVRPAAVSVLFFAVLGCGDTEPAPDPATEDPCPQISMDRMEGRWIRYEGRADHTWRYEIVLEGTVSGSPELWLTSGGWTKRRMVGERRTTDWQFTEVPDDRKRTAYDKGEEGLKRLYVEPFKKKCSHRVSQVDVYNKDGAESERPKPGFVEFIEFPEQYNFTFRPCDGPLFFGEAATRRVVANQQETELGGPDPSSTLGDALTVGTWVSVDADGDPACTYDMDLYFDDQPAKGQDGSPRGPVTAADQGDGWHQWLVSDWYAPFSGNHHFQAYRYRTCAGGPRTLLGVSCVEAVLQ